MNECFNGWKNIIETKKLIEKILNYYKKRCGGSVDLSKDLHGLSDTARFNNEWWNGRENNNKH